MASGFALRLRRTTYHDVLGLHVLERAVESAGLGAHGSDRPLVWLHAKAGVKPVPRRGAFGLYHFAILLPDRAALGQFAEHLSRTRVRVGMADHLVSEALYLTDRMDSASRCTPIARGIPGNIMTVNWR